MSAKGDLQMLRGWLADLPPQEAATIEFAAQQMRDIINRNEQIGVMALQLVVKEMESGE